MTHGSLTPSRPSHVHSQRRGEALFFVIIGLVIIGLLAGAVWYLVAQASVPEEIQIIQFAREILELTGSSSEIDFQPLPEDDPKKRKPGWPPSRVFPFYSKYLQVFWPTP